MPKLGAASLTQLDTCDKRLQAVINKTIEYFDFTVLEGHRGEEAQNRAYAKGLSQVRWPQGKHNSLPSKALDLAPYPIDWSSREAATQRFVYLAGWVMAIAATIGIKLRWGGDWDGDRDTRDEHFRDLGHFEILESE
jgi:peptidoglycan L-alanyl-D-glutamate endopeptidase CwlK